MQWQEQLRSSHLTNLYSPTGGVLHQDQGDLGQQLCGNLRGGHGEAIVWDFECINADYILWQVVRFAASSFWTTWMLNGCPQRAAMLEHCSFALVYLAGVKVNTTALSRVTQSQPLSQSIACWHQFKSIRPISVNYANCNLMGSESINLRDVMFVYHDTCNIQPLWEGCRRKCK